MNTFFDVGPYLINLALVTHLELADYDSTEELIVHMVGGGKVVFDLNSSQAAKLITYIADEACGDFHRPTPPRRPKR